MRSKKGFVWMYLVMVLAIIVGFLIVAGIGEFTIFGKTIRIVPLSFSQEIKFWSLVLTWIIVQIAVILAYSYIYKLFKSLFKFSRNKFAVFTNFVKRVFHH